MDINDVFPEGLDITKAYDLLQPVIIYILRMSVYAVFIFKFYQFVSSKDGFVFDLSKYEKPGFGRSGSSSTACSTWPSTCSYFP